MSGAGFDGVADDAGVLRAIGAARIVPVVTIDDAAVAADLVGALVAGGLPAVEITLRTPAALDAIRAAAADVSAAVVGVGSVTSVAALHEAVDAGARFAVSPGFDPRLVDAARERGVPFVPGVATASELMHAVDHGVGVVKLFPAEQLGGPAMVTALGAVWPDIRFVPTGGVSAANLSGYLALRRVLAVGGSWMVPRDAVTERAWSTVTELASAAAELARPSS